MLHISLPQTRLSAMARLPHDVIGFARDLDLYSDKDERDREREIDEFLDEINNDDERDLLEGVS